MHSTLDVLSQNPVNDPVPPDQLAEEPVHSHYQIAAIQQRSKLSVNLQDAHNAALNNTIYNKIKSLVINGFPGSKAELPDDLKPFWNACHNLAFDDELIVYCCCLFIPCALCHHVLFNLHESHQGVTHTNERARYWPGIDRDIETIKMAFKECQDELPSLAKEPMIFHALPDHPFKHLALDFAQWPRLSHNDRLLYRLALNTRDTAKYHPFSNNCLARVLFTHSCS